MSETVVLISKIKQAQVLNLPHGVVPEHASMGVVGVYHSAVASTRTVKGRKQVEVERTVKAFRRPISGSITLRAKGQDGSEITVARSALQAPDVRAALQRGDVAIQEDVPDASGTDAAEPTAPEPEEASAPPVLAPPTPAPALRGRGKE